jgi:hypothetical protein
VEEKTKSGADAPQINDDRELLMTEAIRVDALFRSGVISTVIK